MGQYLKGNKKPSALRFAFSACLFRGHPLIRHAKIRKNIEEKKYWA